MNDVYKLYGNNSENVESLLEKVARSNIYFGHQSVGWNIISGIEELEKESGVQLSKLETRDFDDTDKESFFHFPIGKNSDPKSKIDDFASIVENVPDSMETLAFFKFCYVDITSSTNVDELFGYYKDAMLRIRDQHPEIKIVLLTIPITGIQKGWKGGVKKALGRTPFGYIENMKRYQFNTMLKDELKDDFPVFDLALVESTLPDGSINTYSFNGVDYPCMPDQYTSDGGHLNEYGSRIAAYNLLAFLTMELD